MDDAGIGVAVDPEVLRLGEGAAAAVVGEVRPLSQGGLVEPVEVLPLAGAQVLLREVGVGPVKVLLPRGGGVFRSFLNPLCLARA